MSERLRQPSVDELLRAVRGCRQRLTSHPDGFVPILANELAASGMEWSVIDAFLERTGEHISLRLLGRLRDRADAVSLPATDVRACAAQLDGVVVGTGRGELMTFVPRRMPHALAHPPVPAHPGPVSFLTWVARGRMVLSGGEDGTLHVWTPITDERVSFRGLRGRVTAAAMCPRFVAGGTADGTLMLWERQTRLPIGALAPHGGAVQVLEWSTDERWLISGAADGTLRIWEMPRATLHVTLPHHRGSITACRFFHSTSGIPAIVSAGSDGLLKFWSPEARTLTLAGHVGAIHDLCDTPSSEESLRQLSVGADGSARLWDLSQGVELRSLHERRAARRVIVRPDGRALIAHDDGSCVVWDFEVDAVVARYPSVLPEVAVMSVAAETAAFVSPTGEAFGLDLNVESHPEKPVCLAFTKEHQQLVSVAGGRELTFGVSTAPAQLTRLGGDGAAIGVASASLVDRIAILRPDGALTLRLASGAVHEELTVDADARCIGISADGSTLAIGTESGALLFWTASRKLLQHRSESVRAPIRACVCDASGRVALAAAENGALHLWRPESGQLLRTLSGGSAPLHDCDITHDGSLALSASSDGSIRVWDIQTGKLLRRLESHTAAATACWFGGRTGDVFSCSLDGTLRRWDLQTGACVDTFYASAPLVALAVNPEERRLATATADGQTLLLALR